MTMNTYAQACTQYHARQFLVPAGGCASGADSASRLTAQVLPAEGTGSSALPHNVPVHILGVARLKAARTAPPVGGVICSCMPGAPFGGMITFIVRLAAAASGVGACAGAGAGVGAPWPRPPPPPRPRPLPRPLPRPPRPPPPLSLASALGSGDSGAWPLTTRSAKSSLRVRTKPESVFPPISTCVEVAVASNSGPRSICAKQRLP